MNTQRPGEQIVQLRREATLRANKLFATLHGVDSNDRIERQLLRSNRLALLGITITVVIGLLTLALSS